MKNKNTSNALQYSILIKRAGLLSLIILLITLGTTENLFAQGSLLLTPKRVVFEGKKIVRSSILPIWEKTPRNILSRWLNTG